MLVGTMAINLSSATVSQSWNSNQEATHLYIVFSTFLKTVNRMETIASLLIHTENIAVEKDQIFNDIIKF